MLSFGVHMVQLNLLPQSIDLTELARQGKLDPTIGRDEGVYFEFSKKSDCYDLTL